MAKDWMSAEPPTLFSLVRILLLALPFWIGALLATELLNLAIGPIGQSIYVVIYLLMILVFLFAGTKVFKKTITTWQHADVQVSTPEVLQKGFARVWRGVAPLEIHSFFIAAMLFFMTSQILRYLFELAPQAPIYWNLITILFLFGGFILLLIVVSLVAGLLPDRSTSD